MGEELGVSARVTPGAAGLQSRRAAATALEASFPGLQENTGAWGYFAGSESLLVRPLIVFFQRNKETFRKQTAWTEKDQLVVSHGLPGRERCVSPRPRSRCHAQASRFRSLASPGASAGFSASLARSCSVSCSLVGIEFFLGRPLGLVGDSRPPPCSTCQREGQPFW